MTHDARTCGALMANRKERALMPVLDKLAALKERAAA
jgi:hypothetical protein